MLWIVTLMLSFAACAQTTAQHESIAITNAVVVDVANGSIICGQTILIRDDIIASIGPGESVRLPSGTQTSNIDGRYVIPGLWDMHIHPDSESDLGLLIANGVVGARIMNGLPEHLEWREKIQNGRMIGPRLLISGPIIEGSPPLDVADLTAAADMNLITTADSARQEVQDQRKAGFDYIKVYNNLPSAVHEALVDEASKVNIPIVGHVPFQVGLDNALASGQASIEHLRGYVQALVPEDAPIRPGVELRSRTLAWQYADAARIQSLVQETLQAGSYICPTLAFRIFFAGQDEIDAYLRSVVAAYMTTESAAVLADRSRLPWLSNFGDADYVAAALGFRMQDELIRAMQTAGIPLLAGTDSSPLGFTLHEELERLVAAGLSPAEALRTATINPARFAGKTRSRGQILPGFEADMVILDENPLENISNTNRVFAVMLRGQLLDRARLDRFLEAGRSRAD
jgi:Amidohydrolase family